MIRIKLYKHKECPVPTVWGWCALLLLLITGGACAILNIHSFLSLVRPVRGEILVAEGWMPDYALEKAVEEFKNHPYRLLVTTGIPIDKGNYLSSYKTFAEVGAVTSRKIGLDSALVVAVEAPFVHKDRTFASAVAFGEWLKTYPFPVKAVNVYSLGAHSRRTHLLFSKVLGKKISVGIIACDDCGYDKHRWWKSSAGVRTVLDQAIAYSYARFFFNTRSGGGRKELNKF